MSPNPVRSLALALGALLVSTGCATTTRVPLTDAQRSSLGSVKTVAAVAQQEVAVSIVPSTAGAAFGLVGAIVDATTNKGRVKTAEEAAVPVRNALVGQEAPATLRAALSKELQGLPWLKGNAIEAKQLAPTTEAVTALVKESKTDLVLLVQVDHRLTPDFGAMVITAEVSLLGKPPPRDPNAPQTPENATPPPPPKLYFNTLWTQAPLPGWSPPSPPPVPTKEALDAAAQRWAADGGKLARRAFEGGIAELARMIAFDLAQGGPAGATSPAATYETPPGAKVVTAAGKFGVGVASGFVLREEKGRAWSRLGSGELTASGELF